MGATKGVSSSGNLGEDFSKSIHWLFFCGVERAKDSFLHFSKTASSSKCCLWMLSLSSKNDHFVVLFKNMLSFLYLSKVRNSRNVYECGSVSYWKLGTEYMEDRFVPTRLELRNRIKSVACGRWKTFFLSNKGEVFESGVEPWKSLEKPSIVPVRVPLVVSHGLANAEARITKVSSGFTHIAFLTEEGKVFAYGDGYNWNLGNWHLGIVRLQDEQVPSVFSLRSTIVDVSCGQGHTVFVDEHGGAFSCGRGNRGELGLGDTFYRTDPTHISTDVKVVKARCGYCCTFVFSDTGETLGCGAGGKLGLVDGTDKIVLTRVPLENLVDAACGHDHTIFLAKDGTVFACGNGPNGQLGLGSKGFFATPQRVALSRVVSISCGGYHTAFVTATGDLFTCGKADRGQLGYKSTRPVLVPTRVPLFISRKVRSVYCGEEHTVILT